MALFGLDINFNIAIAAVVTSFIAWRFFKYMEKRPEKLKRVDMAKETASRSAAESEENDKFKGWRFRVGNKYKGKIAGSIIYKKSLPTTFDNPTGAPNNFEEMIVRNITIKKGFFLWRKKKTYVVLESEINKTIDIDEIVIPSDTEFTKYEGLWISERINPVASRIHALATVDKIIMERTTSEYATMMENVSGYLPHHGHESHMIEKETEAIEKRKADLRENA